LIFALLCSAPKSGVYWRPAPDAGFRLDLLKSLYPFHRRHAFLDRDGRRKGGFGFAHLEDPRQ
jgi:hypothetical protein